MGLANIHGQKIGALFIVVVDLDDVANLAAERRSSKASEHQYERTFMSSFANVETVDAVQGDNSRVRRVAANFQRAAMHVRQGIPDHPIGILGAPGHV